MAKVIDYYLSVQSPWTYLGHRRLVELAARHQAAVNIRPVDHHVVFPATGGLPLAKRAPARRAYRLAELRRWRDFLSLPLTLQPRHFPADDGLATRMVIAVREAGGDAVALAGRLLAAVWVEERDIADRETLLAIARSSGLDGNALIAEADTDALERRVVEDSQQAIARGVFGMPTYVYRDELYWGQDRLDFLARALAA